MPASLRIVIGRLRKVDESARFVFGGPYRAVFGPCLVPELNTETLLSPGILSGEMSIGARNAHSRRVQGNGEEVVKVDECITMGTEECALGHATQYLP